MNFSKCTLGKNILGQLKGGMKILFITVLIYAEENCKSSTHKKLQLVVNLCMDYCSIYKH